MFLEGSAKLLTKYFQKTCDKDNIKVAFIGDHYLSDTHATHEFNIAQTKDGCKAQWDAITVIEEFHHEDSSYGEGVDARLIPHNKDIWGPSFFLEADKDNRRNFFVAEVEKVARYAIPFVKNLKYLLNQPKTNTEKIDPKSGIIDEMLPMVI